MQVQLFLLILESARCGRGIEVQRDLFVNLWIGRLKPDNSGVSNFVTAPLALTFRPFLYGGELGRWAFVGCGGHLVDFPFRYGKADSLSEIVAAHAVVENNIGIRACVETP